MEQGLTGGDGFGGVGLVIGLETTGAKRATSSGSRKAVRPTAPAFNPAT